MNKLMTNYGILELYELISNVFYKNEDNYIPVKAGFILRNNYLYLESLVKRIEEYRVSICKKYGKIDENNSEYYIIEEKEKEQANKELMDLYNMEQPVKLEELNYEDIKDIKMNMNQIEILSIMIKQEEEEK